MTVTKNFNKVEGACLYKGHACSITYHSYESDKKLYDVLIIELPDNSRVRLYDTNKKPCEPTPIHRAIEKHFNL